MKLHVTVLFVALLAVVLASAPMREIPGAMDAESYVRMARDPFSLSVAHPHHNQRILPSLAVAGLHALFQFPVSAAFQALAASGFLILGLLVYRAMLPTGSPHAMAGGALTLLVVLANWVIRYNLNNVYQLCDLYTYIIVLILACSLHRNRLAWFGVGLVAIFVRQNLWILVAAGDLYFLVQALFAGGAWGQWTRPKVSRFLRDFLGGVLHACAVLILLLGVPDHGAGTFSHLGGDAPAFRAWVQAMLYLSMPFTFLFLLRIPALLSAMARNWPVAVFGIITVCQPFAVYERTGYDNSLRVAMQGVFPAAVWCAREALRMQKDRTPRPVLMETAVVLLVWTALNVAERLTVHPDLKPRIEWVAIKVLVSLAYAFRLWWVGHTSAPTGGSLPERNAGVQA